MSGTPREKPAATNWSAFYHVTSRRHPRPGADQGRLGPTGCRVGPEWPPEAALAHRARVPAAQFSLLSVAPALPTAGRPNAPSPTGLPNPQALWARRRAPGPDPNRVEGPSPAPRPPASPLHARKGPAASAAELTVAPSRSPCSDSRRHACVPHAHRPLCIPLRLGSRLSGRVRARFASTHTLRPSREGWGWCNPSLSGTLLSGTRFTM